MKPILALQHVPHETLRTVQPALSAAGLPCRRVDLYRSAARRLPLDRVAGLVVLGGPMNVDETDSHPFLAHEIGWYPIELAPQAADDLFLTRPGTDRKGRPWILGQLEAPW